MPCLVMRFRRHRADAHPAIPQFRWEAATFWGRIRIILEDAARIGIPLVCVALTGGGATSMVLAGSATYATVIGAYNVRTKTYASFFQQQRSLG